jgi:hypothetical protein
MSPYYNKALIALGADVPVVLLLLLVTTVCSASGRKMHIVAYSRLLLTGTYWD